jgi:hypothetical protein
MESHDYHVYLKALPSCTAGESCDFVRARFLNHFIQFRLFGTLLIGLPALIGAFWGAPLVTRELEAGTQRLAWTQSVSRTRWIATRLLVVGLATALLAGLFSLGFSWWSAPSDHVELNRFDPSIFGQRGVVPIGYALFAFALGVAAGVVARRTLAAMGIAIVGFTAVRMGFQYWVRPHLYAAVHHLYPLASAPGIGFERSPAGLAIQAGPPGVPGAWVISAKVVDSAGHAPTSAALAKACPALMNNGPGAGGPIGAGHHVVQAAPPAAGAFQNCVQVLTQRYHLDTAFQPASRFWMFQWTEFAIFIGLAVALAGFSVWWLRRRLQ